MYACLFIAKECNVVLVYARAGLRVSWRSQILGVLVNLIHLWDYYLRSGSAHFPEDGPALFLARSEEEGVSGATLQRTACGDDVEVRPAQRGEPEA